VADFSKKLRAYLMKAFRMNLISAGSISEAVDMNGRFPMQGGKNWILPK
jgi:hypothetical protein